ncbi:MAG TPA: DNA polymerase IV, partial [Roseiflexaceae bacterium]|nr:DNA polymerase IV [Roseiflexaceae bacterium]
MHAAPPRTILHLDLDAFFCAVEEQRDPSRRGKPFAVGGKPEERGVVSSCSYAARQYGVRSAMPMSRAVALCPGLIVVSSHFIAYRAASAQVMARLREVTALVEQISIDEAF